MVVGLGKVESMIKKINRQGSVAQYIGVFESSTLTLAEVNFFM
jgi:hypothetical protein